MARPSLTITAEAVAGVIADLPNRDASALRTLWRQVAGREPGPGVKGELLRAALAHRLQEKVLGGVSSLTLRRLKLLAGEAATDIRQATAANAASGQIDRDGTSDGRTSHNRTVHDKTGHASRRIKPGSRLIREWRGVIHEVVVLPDGFLWDGITHSSLSAIARSITGTSWNGWRFFGLDQRQHVKQRAKGDQHVQA